MNTMKTISVLLFVCLITNLSWAQSSSEQKKSKNYKAFEMSVSEGLNLQAAAKIGIKPIYGIFGVGTQFLAENKESFGHTFVSTFAPYDIYSNVGDNHTAKGWIGFTLGIRFDK